jgi:hypothetical protein
MLLIFDRAQSHVPLKILSIEDGSVLKAFNHLLHRNKKVDFIEQFNEKLLVKQENENLQILDVWSSSQRTTELCCFFSILVVNDNGSKHLKILF